MERKFKFFKSFMNDYLLQVTVIFSVVTLIWMVVHFYLSTSINVYLNLLKTDFFSTIFYDDFIQFEIPALLFIPSVICTAIRIRYIKSFEGEVIKLSGTITKYSTYRSTCSITVEYKYESQPINKHFAFGKTKLTKNYKSMGNVTLIMKDDNPKHVLIEELYFELL